MTSPYLTDGLYLNLTQISFLDLVGELKIRPVAHRPLKPVPDKFNQEPFNLRPEGSLAAAGSSWQIHQRLFTSESDGTSLKIESNLGSENMLISVFLIESMSTPTIPTPTTTVTFLPFSRERQ